MTARLVKFSDAMSSRPVHWRRFSCSIRSYISGSCSSRGTRPVNFWSLKEVMVAMADRNKLCRVPISFARWFSAGRVR